MGRVVAADLNGDGKLDLIANSYDTNTVAVLLNNGHCEFDTQTSCAAGSCLDNVAVGDVNGDGKPDIVVGNKSSNTVSLLLGDGQGGFGAATSYTVNSNLINVAVADLKAMASRTSLPRTETTIRCPFC